MDTNLRARVRDGDPDAFGQLFDECARAVMRNVSRAERRHKAALERLPPPSRMPDFSEDVAGRLDDAATIEALRLAVGKLRRGEREVLMLCVFSGLGYADAAKALGIPVGTVRSRLARVRRKLRGMVDGAGPHPADPAPEAAASSRELRAAGAQQRGSRITAARPKQGRTR